MSSSENTRLDVILVRKGLVETRSRARDLIKRGRVTVDGTVSKKPATSVAEAAEIVLTGSDAEYVSRGSLKLLGALDHFLFDVADCVALDLGASTGGFCQVLLERGVRKVYAVDVGRDQLNGKIRDDDRVISLEGQDSRALTRDLIVDDIDIVTADLSFISLKKALPIPLEFVSRRASLVALIKPQFEVGRDAVGKGGIVRDEEKRQACVDDICDWISKQGAGWSVEGVIASPITGQGGNKEYLLGASYDG